MKKKLEKHKRRMFYRKVNAFGAQGRNNKTNSGYITLNTFSLLNPVCIHPFI